MKLLLRLVVPIIALIGLLDAGYLTYEKLLHIVPPCQVGFACDTVLQSRWAVVGPIPLSLFGMVYYALTLLIGGLYVLEKDEVVLGGKRFSLLYMLLAWTSLGFLFSLWFVFLMAVVLKAWCLYCLVSALTSTLLFVVVRLLAVVSKQGREELYPLHTALIALMYQHVLRPLFFLCNPEIVHELMVSRGEVLGKFPLTRWITHRAFAYTHPQLEKTIAGVKFPNPVGLSAGFDYDAKLTTILPSVGFGFATIGTVTLKPYPGNPKPMLTRFPKSKAILVNKGFKSEGAKAIISKLEGTDFVIPIGISIGSTNQPYDSIDDQIDDIMQCFTLFEHSDVRNAYYELNISCPNTKGGSLLLIPNVSKN